MNYNGSSVSEPEKISKSLIFFVESIASSNKDNVEECDHSKLKNFISRACFSISNLKALITLEQVITSVVEKKNNLNEQNFEVYWKTRIEDPLKKT